MKYQAYSLAERKEYALTLSQAGDLVPKSLWGPTTRQDGTPGPPAPSAGKLLLVMETGAMLGLHPMAALQSIDVVEGRPTLSAKLMAALIRKHGHILNVVRTGSIPGGDYKVRVEGTRSDSGETAYSEWDIPRAMRAGLVQSYQRNSQGQYEVRARSQNNGLKPWEAHAESMPWNRAISDVGRQLFSDVLFGLYSTEELRDSAEELPEEDAPVEPSTDWAALIDAASTKEELTAIAARIKAASEGSDLLKLKYATKLGVLETEANIEDAEEVNDDERSGDERTDAGSAADDGVPADDAGGDGTPDIRGDATA